MNKLRDDDTVGKSSRTTSFPISESALSSGQRTARGLRRIRSQRNSQGEKRSGSYRPHCGAIQRSACRRAAERINPSGLLVAEYSEKQMVGERDNGLEQKSELDK